LHAEIRAYWLSDNEVKITTAYNNYDIHLDPKTGKPLNRFGEICSP